MLFVAAGIILLHVQGANSSSFVVSTVRDLTGHSIKQNVQPHTTADRVSRLDTPREATDAYEAYVYVMLLTCDDCCW